MTEIAFDTENLLVPRAFFPATLYRKDTVSPYAQEGMISSPATDFIGNFHVDTHEMHYIFQPPAVRNRLRRKDRNDMDYEG